VQIISLNKVKTPAFAGVSISRGDFLKEMIERLKASALHLGVSIFVAVLSAILVFVFWYPEALAHESNVHNIFILLCISDVVLGPVITLIIFKKQKQQFMRDLSVVALIQLAALLYGLHAVFAARPVYIVYNAGAFDLAYANEMSQENLKKAKNPKYRSLPVFGPHLVAADLPSDSYIAEKIILSAVNGGDDIQHLPEYFSPYEAKKEVVLKNVKPLTNLSSSRLANKEKLNDLQKKYAGQNRQVGYLPLRGTEKKIYVLVDQLTGEFLEISELT
jgi:hypothetical protein